MSRDAALQDANRELSGTVSIVIPTYNRIERLSRCIHMIRQNVRCPRELIVVDGHSTDGTRELLASCDDCRCIWETSRQGAVKAFARGFRAARGEYVMWLNDDAWPLPGSVEAARDLLCRPDCVDVGMVAFYHNWHSPRNVLDRVDHEGQSYELCHVRGFPYANFGLLRRRLLEQVGYIDEGFYFFGFDPDLALTLQLRMGLAVVGCPDALIYHEEYHDQRKRDDLDAGERDNRRLFAKWNLPAPGTYPDPRPAYKRMLAERNITRRASSDQGRYIPVHLPTSG